MSNSYSLANCAKRRVSYFYDRKVPFFFRVVNKVTHTLFFLKIDDVGNFNYGPGKKSQK